MLATIKHLTMKTAIKLTISLVFFGLFLTEISIAQNQDNFTPNLTIGDGSDGRIWSQWRQSVRELPIEEIAIKLRKTKGGDEAFVNLRFEGGQTLESGKREYLKDNNTQNLTWVIGGESPRGKQLVLNAYKAEVFVEAVRVKYRAPILPPSSSGGSISGPDDDNDDIQPTKPNSPATDDYALDPNIARECKGQYFRRPRIEVEEARPSGGLFSDKQKISGNVIGACIEEAGYFESGRLKERIDIPYTSSFKRYEFRIGVRTGRNGELRVYTTQGDEERVSIDELVQDSAPLF